MSFLNGLKELSCQSTPIIDEIIKCKCETHGEYEARKVQYESGLKYTAACPACLEEWKVEEERKEAIEREAHKIASARKRRREMGIEQMYDDATFATFNADTPILEKAVKVVRDLVDGNVKKIVMIGANGTGKTHLACAALQEIGGKIMTMFEISATLRATYSGDGNELAALDEMANYPLFVIDEIGRTKGSDADANWLSYIIDKRHVRGLPTILISNKHTRKTCAKEGCADCLENYIAEDVMSRLCENGVLLRFSGDDYRRKEGRHVGG